MRDSNKIANLIAEELVEELYLEYKSREGSITLTKEIFSEELFRYIKRAKPGESFFGGSNPKNYAILILKVVCLTLR